MIGVVSDSVYASKSDFFKTKLPIFNQPNCPQSNILFRFFFFVYWSALIDCDYLAYLQIFQLNHISRFSRDYECANGKRRHFENWGDFAHNLERFIFITFNFTLVLQSQHNKLSSFLNYITTVFYFYECNIFCFLSFCDSFWCFFSPFSYMKMKWSIRK